MFNNSHKNCFSLLLQLYGMFLNYMTSQQTGGNLQFLRQARLYRMMRRPRVCLVRQALTLIWTFFAECAPLPVTVSAEERKRLCEMTFSPEAELTIDADTFAVAFGEVYNVVVPHFRNWLSTNEWREAIPFHHLPQPSFNVVLASSTLRVLFNKYLKAQLDRDTDGSATHAFHLWKFCIIANDFRDGKCNHTSHLETKKKSKGGEGASADAASAASEKTRDDASGAASESSITPEEYAKRLYKKYKHQISLPYDSSMTYAIFIVRALDHAIEEFGKSALYARWLALKQYQGVDYQAKTVHQTLTADGYVEPPTLAAALTSGLLPFFRALCAGTEHRLNIDFLIEVLKFRSHFDGGMVSPIASQTGSQGGSSSGTSRKDMIEEARRIFNTYLEGDVMYCDPRLVEEVRDTLSKAFGKGVTPAMFRRCGAFIYQRSENSWCREARATFAWVNKSYDNRSKAARAVEEEFSMRVLPVGIDCQCVPTIDDCITNAELLKDFVEYLPKEVSEPFMKFRAAYYEYLKLPQSKRKAEVERVVNFYGANVPNFPELESFYRVFEKETAKRDRLTDTAFQYSAVYLVRAIAKKYYAEWCVEHSLVWKSAAWELAPSITFSQLNSVITMSSISSKITEYNLKGKKGLSRYFAKREVKKQTSINLRVAPAKTPTGKANQVIMSSFDPLAPEYLEAQGTVPDGDVLGVKAKEAEGDSSSLVMTVPTLEETLCSSYLRRLFCSVYLDGTLSAAEHEMWDGFCAFYGKYSAMRDEEVLASQDDMRTSILNFVSKFKNIMKDPAKIKARAEKEKVLLPQFFRDDEIAEYRAHHTKYEAELKKLGWK